MTSTVPQIDLILTGHQYFAHHVRVALYLTLSSQAHELIFQDHYSFVESSIFHSPNPYSKSNAKLTLSVVNINIKEIQPRFHPGIRII